MKFSNILEKLEVIFNLITSSNILIILAILLIGIIILKLSNKINNVKMGIMMYLVEFISFVVVCLLKKDFMTNLSTTLIDNIFLNFYFPSIYVYLLIFVFTHIIFIKNLLNKFLSKTYKIISNIYFILFNFIFILLVDVIATNNIDIFTKHSLYTNNSALVLLELSTLLFFLYIVTNTLIYITNNLIIFVETRAIRRKETKTMITSPVLEVDLTNDSVQEPEPVVNELKSVQPIQEKIDLVPEITANYRFIDPALFEVPLKEEVIYNNSSLEEKLNFIDFSVIKNKNENKITLDDYKMFNNMLKAVVRSSNNTNLTVEDILNKTLLNYYSFDEYLKFEKILNSCITE